MEANSRKYSQAMHEVEIWLAASLSNSILLGTYEYDLSSSHGKPALFARS